MCINFHVVHVHLHITMSCLLSTANLLNERRTNLMTILKGSGNTHHLHPLSILHKYDNHAKHTLQEAENIVNYSSPYYCNERCRRDQSNCSNRHTLMDMLALHDQWISWLATQTSTEEERGWRWWVLPKTPFRMVMRLVLLSLRWFAVDNRQLMVMCKCTCTTWKFMHMSVKVRLSCFSLCLRQWPKERGISNFTFYSNELHCSNSGQLWSRCNAWEAIQHCSLAVDLLPHYLALVHCHV